MAIMSSVFTESHLLLD